MKLPRNLSAKHIIKTLHIYQYNIDRQKGSHIRLSSTYNGEHHITIPNHHPPKVGGLSSILTEIAIHFGKRRKR